MKRRALLALFPSAALAFPERAITLVVPFAAGGSTDIAARLLAERLTGLLATRVVVENRTGAGGALGSEAVKRAPADGHTLLFASASSHGANPAVFRDLSYDAVADFAAVALTGVTPLALAVPPGGARDVAGLRAQLADGRGAYGSAGAGSNVHIGMVAFLDAAGLQMVHVPYRGSGPMTIDLVAGNIDSGMTGTPAALPLIRADRMAALGTTAARRLSQTPDVPAISETLPGFEAMQWYGLVAPARTPPEIVARLHAATNAALADEQVRHRLADEGALPDPRSAAEFRSFIASELERWGVVARRNNLRPNE
jgi:tripartite-type tricarboxylate transporter receptor subunit TctC